MRLFGINIAKWTWGLYPMIVAGVLIFGTNYLLTSGELSQVKLASRQEEVEAQKKIVNELRTKLEKLKKVDEKRGLEDVQTMLAAVPAGKKVWLALGDVTDAASIAGVILDGYKGKVGDVTEATEAAKVEENADKEVKKTAPAKVKVVKVEDQPLTLALEYLPMDFDRLIRMIGEMEKDLPLLKINGIKYEERSVEIEIEVASQPWKKVMAKSDMPVPAYETEVARALKTISEMN